MPRFASMAQLRPLAKQPSPVDRFAQIAEITGNIQGDRQNQQIRQMAIQKAQREQQQAEAVGAAIMETGGDIEAALPKIAQVAPDLLPHYQDYVDKRKQQGIANALATRKGQLENIDILSNTPAEEVPITTPAGTLMVPKPVEPQQVSGVPQLNIPGVTARVESPQQRMKRLADKARADAEQKLKDEITLKREQQKAELEFNTTNPPKPSFEELTYQDYLKSPEAAKFGANRMGFNRYQQQQRADVAAANRIDPEQVVNYSEDGVQKVGIVNKRTHQIDELKTPGGANAEPGLTSEQRNKTAARELVGKSIGAVKTLGDRIITRVGPTQRAEAIKRGVEAVFGSDPDFRTYQDARMALAGNLAVGQQGSRPSDADIKAIWLPLVPDPYRDTKESAAMKWELINTMSNIGKPAAGAGGLDEALDKAFGKKK